MTNYDTVHCNTCGNQVCQSCGCCASSNCESASCPERDLPDAEFIETSPMQAPAGLAARQLEAAKYAYLPIEVLNAEGLSIEELQSHIESVDLPLETPPLIEVERTPRGAVIRVGMVGSGKRSLMKSVIWHLSEPRQSSPDVVITVEEAEVFSKKSLDRLREIGREAQKRPEFPDIKVSSMSNFVRNKR